MLNWQIQCTPKGTGTNTSLDERKKKPNNSGRGACESSAAVELVRHTTLKFVLECEATLPKRHIPITGHEASEASRLLLPDNLSQKKGLNPGIRDKMLTYTCRQSSNSLGPACTARMPLVDGQLSPLRQPRC